MAYSYDEHMGDEQPAYMGSQSQTGTQMAGDLIDIRGALIDKQIREHMSDSPKPPPRMGGMNVYPIRPENPQGKK